MLSPRTLALRKKNRDLLEALDLKVCDRKTSVNESVIEGSNASRSDIHNPLTHHFGDTTCQAVFKNQRALEQLTQTYSHENFSGIQSTLSSGDPVPYTKVYGSASGTANSSQKKTLRNKTEKNMSTYRSDERIKSISLHQQRAAEVQMHARTHSHVISKCYCTQENNTRPRVDSKYIVQLYGRRQRIPTRIKEQRYRAASVPRNLRAVRWADACDHMEKRSTKVNDDVSTFSSCDLSEGSIRNDAVPEIFPFKHSTSVQNESEETLLDKVKVFRESHWSDCHARNIGTSPTDHECVKHYVLNERLFLEPLHRDEGGESSCPVCPPFPKNLCRSKCNLGTSKNLLNSTHTHQSSHIIVTLPKVIEGHENMSIGRPLSSQQKRIKEDSLLKTCYSVGHHAHSAKKSVFVCPSDSLALRYQKRDI